MGYTIIESPHNYFPNDSTIAVQRFVASENNVEAGHLDFFVKDDLTVLLSVWVQPERRTGEFSLNLIRRMIQDIVRTPQIVAYHMNPRVRELWDILVQEFPDLTHVDLPPSGIPRTV